MRVQEILISHHSHTDIGYTHEQPVLWELQARYIEQAMDLIEETMDWPEGARLKWTCEVTAPVLYWLKAAKSRDVERFAEHARAGYIEVTALFCNLTPLCNLEELHRLLLPVARLRRELGIPVRTAMNSDVNGLPWPLVDLLLDSGITGVTMAINEHMGGAPLERPLAFWWVGPSGRKILAYNGLHYGFLQLYGLGEDPVQEAHARIIEWLESHPVANRMPVLYVQNTRRDHWDNNGPSEKLAPFVREWNEAGLMPRLRLVTPVEAMERLAALPAGMIQEVRGDWHDYWNFGAGSSVEPLRINRRSRRYLYDAEAIAALHKAHTVRDRELVHEAWTDLMLFDEHTWGAWNSVREPDTELARAQWAFKEHYANRAAALSQFVRRRAIANWAAQVSSPHETPAVLVYNPYPVTIERRLRIPQDWRSRELPTSLAHQHRYDEPWRREAPFLVTKPIRIPALGWCVVPIEEGTEAGDDGANGAKSEAGGAGAPASQAPGFQISAFRWDPETLTLTTPEYEIRLDPSRQGIVSWKDVKTGRQFVDASAGYRFGQVIYERSTAPQPWRELWPGRWNPDWPAMRIAGVPASPVRLSREPGSIVLSQEVSIPEFPQITWRLRVADDQPGIGIEIAGSFPDRAMPEALYLCFPLASDYTEERNHNAPAQTGRGPNWQAWYTTAGLPVLYDREQLPGSCRDYITTDTWAYMEPGGAGFGMQLICPDNPLLTFGGFHFGKRLLAVPEDAPAWIIAWVSNTYWQTNFRPKQPGPFRQRYALVPHDAGASVGPLNAAADRILCEPVLHPIPRSQQGAAASEGQALKMTLGETRLVSLSPAEDDEGIVLRLFNPTEAAQAVTIAPASLRIERAWLCTPVEERREELDLTGGSLSLTIPPRSPRCVMLKVSERGAPAPTGDHPGP